LNPRLYVKIVDACHSGVTYIKSADEFTEYLKSAQPAFNKLYFLFSSQSEQFSYQNNSISYFTESILKAVSYHGGDTIRYKDIIDFVSDDFGANEFQTPFFVTQADFTEIFVGISPTLRDRLNGYIQVAARIEHSPVPQNKAMSIVERLRRDADNYCNKDEAIAVMKSIPLILSGVSISSDLAELYEVTVTTDKNAPAGAISIGKWLDQNKEERGYFAEPIFVVEKVTRRIQKRWFEAPTTFTLLRGARGLGRDEDYDTITDNRRVLKGFRMTFDDPPYQHINIQFSPTLPNITPEECLIVPILSRTHLRLFWAFSHFDYIGWNESRRVGTLEWSTADAPLKSTDQIRQITSEIEKRFSAFVEEPLRAKWEPVSEPTVEVAVGSDESTKPEATGLNPALAEPER
jgi:hypothetical protein